MLVALSADMEGVSQLDDWRAIFAFEPAYWREGRAQMEAEVAAAARGLLTGGADEVVVLDNHVSGNPVNIRAESLPARARLETWDVFELRDRGVDALLQVGYHSRAGLDVFVPHTYVPELVLYVDGEPISESHGRAWAAGVPLLGICGNDVHGAHAGVAGGCPLPRHTADIVDDGRSPRRDTRGDRAVRRGRRALGRVPVHPPKRAQLAAFVRAEPLYTLDIGRWEDARQPIADAMLAAIAPWHRYITPFDLTSEDAMTAVQHEPLVREVSAAFEAWLARAGEHAT